MPAKPDPQPAERATDASPTARDAAPGQDLNLGWYRWADFSAARLYELLRFRQAVFVVEQRSPYPDLDGSDAQSEHLLLRRADELIGCLRLIAPDPLVRIGRVAVKAEERGKGLARVMMQAALQRAAEIYPHRDVAVGAQTYLEAFYQSLGFATVSAPYDDHGVPHIAMVGPARGD